MKNEKVKYLLFREREIQELVDAIITKQNCIGDLKNSNEDWNRQMDERINRLESILKSIITTHYVELPQPNAPFTNDLDNNTSYSTNS